MRRKDILKAPLKLPKGKSEKQVTVQVLGDKYIILNLWKKNKMFCRHAMEIHTGEYETYYYDTDVWKQEQLSTITEEIHDWYYGREVNDKKWKLSDEDKKILDDTVGVCTLNNNNFYQITSMEEDYSRDKRWNKMQRKEQRLRELMDSILKPGMAVRNWIEQKLAGDLYYAFYDKQNRTCHCTACGTDFTEQAAGVKLKDKAQIHCPVCDHIVTVMKRKCSVSVKGRLTIIQNVNEKQGVERHFIVTVEWEKQRTVHLEEIIRLMMLRERNRVCKIYYDDNWGSWSEGNRANRRWKTSYLYPDRDGIRAGLEGTAYEIWKDVMPMLAEQEVEADYNGLLIESNQYWVRIAEYLMKGRFLKLLKEETATITPWGGYTAGTLRIGGETIEEVMQIRNKQLINRLRQEDGGRKMLGWMQWSDETGRKISAEALAWYETHQIDVNDYRRSTASKYLSPEQLMNYIKRQQAEGYSGWKVATVLNQYEDYLDMARLLDKHMDDEMVYRPRELKRRHDEAVEEHNRRREEIKRKRDKEAARRQAEQMRQKYPGYEDILLEIKSKYEYADDTYRIMVPGDFTEITAEGMALHHCVGNTERYFDRIVSRETYICFLRQQSSPETPFYTIEVEPGGTIRQHRGAYDEEPDIDKIKPFLRAWQKEIKKRMSKEDHEYAKKSAVLRQKNIEELREKNNTRVLNGLMEDLMEVI